MDAMSGHSATSTEETLDPSDWADVQVLSHRIVDDAVAYLRDVRQRPVWQEMPGDVRDFFTASLPQSPTPLADIYGDVVEKVMPYPMGNIHPRFWSWYMGSSNFTGALGDFLAAIQGSNLGGGNRGAQAALLEELLKQVAYALVVIDDQYVRIGFHGDPVFVGGRSVAAFLSLLLWRHPHDRILATCWPAAMIPGRLLPETIQKQNSIVRKNSRKKSKA